MSNFLKCIVAPLVHKALARGIQYRGIRPSPGGYNTVA
ncbi:hypothetical protein LOK49_LG13G01173 [Camellia lanceoleosa]|uniref:Uncharacterized protein n=1 Tax=Camellia lanceoleosa TaxID=1840588 RepID=A0ACC0FEG1_9ERIC|nr:hypothetical protein LOK49_LG13G01173 [Camellia lanceoleosa]